jgi:hypothetical protein
LDRQVHSMKDEVGKGVVIPDVPAAAFKCSNWTASVLVARGRWRATGEAARTAGAAKGAMKVLVGLSWIIKTPSGALLLDHSIETRFGIVCSAVRVACAWQSRGDGMPEDGAAYPKCHVVAGRLEQLKPTKANAGESHRPDEPESFYWLEMRSYW